MVITVHVTVRVLQSSPWLSVTPAAGVLIRILITLRSILRDIGFSGSIRLNLLRLMQLILNHV